jgi:hypothetical protein
MNLPEIWSWLSALIAIIGLVVVGFKKLRPTFIAFHSTIGAPHKHLKKNSSLKRELLYKWFSAFLFIMIGFWGTLATMCPTLGIVLKFESCAKNPLMLTAVILLLGFNYYIVMRYFYAGIDLVRFTFRNPVRFSRMPW